jgi:hypothetical protein
MQTVSRDQFEDIKAILERRYIKATMDLCEERGIVFDHEAYLRQRNQEEGVDNLRDVIVFGMDIWPDDLEDDGGENATPSATPKLRVIEGGKAKPSALQRVASAAAGVGMMVTAAVVGLVGAGFYDTRVVDYVGSLAFRAVAPEGTSISRVVEVNGRSVTVEVATVPGLNHLRLVGLTDTDTNVALALAPLEDHHGHAHAHLEGGEVLHNQVSMLDPRSLLSEMGVDLPYPRLG